MDLLNICDMLPIKATFRSWWTCGSPWPERNYNLVKEGEKVGKIKKEYKRWSDLCGWPKPHQEKTSSHHTLHGNMHEVRMGLKSMMQCPHILRAC